MYPLYKDIRLRIGPPLWVDQYGVPRYDAFRPELLGIYDNFAVLFTVACQGCNDLFDVGVGCDSMTLGWAGNTTPLSFEDRTDPEKILPHIVCFGDAPWHDSNGCTSRFESQCSGTTMTTSVVKIKQAWQKRNRSHDHRWELLELSPILVQGLIDDSGDEE